MSDHDDHIHGSLQRIRFQLATPEEERERAALAARQRDFERRERVETLLRESNAPKRQLAQSPDRSGAWGVTEAKLAARLGSGFLVALCGSRGNGKTQLAVELMRRTAEAGHRCRYLSAMGFFLDVKATYRKDAADDERAVLTALRRPRLLVIDELGKRGETEWEDRLLFELLDRRYADMTDTLVISNQPRGEFLQAVGPSIASRMQETGGIIEAAWGSFRA